MTLYTGRGDEGFTDLADGSRLPKTDPRIEAIGNVDELNALLGTIRPTGYEDVDERLVAVQNQLHVVQADLAGAAEEENDGPRVTGDHVERLETWIDEAEAEVGTLQRFIIPSGGTAGARLHHARAVCRRAERRTVAAAEARPVSETVTAYLNRLSDALFVLGRVANYRDGEEELEPEY
ncbi:MAG: cob(I)yrinic acid a,c-diamide adenosyltransferase [Halanaeroarchaeum sp.]